MYLCILQACIIRKYTTRDDLHTRIYSVQTVVTILRGVVINSNDLARTGLVYVHRYESHYYISLVRCTSTRFVANCGAIIK